MTNSKLTVIIIALLVIEVLLSEILHLPAFNFFYLVIFLFILFATNLLFFIVKRFLSGSAGKILVVIIFWLCVLGTIAWVISDIYAKYVTLH